MSIAEPGFDPSVEPGIAMQGVLRQLPQTYGNLKKGISVHVIVRLEKEGILDKSDIGMFIPQRTLERRLQENQTLKLHEADGILRLVRVLEHAFRVFEDTNLAEEWMRSPNPELGDEIPIRMTRTDMGAREVEAVLTRIEHGVFG